MDCVHICLLKVQWISINKDQRQSQELVGNNF